MFFEETRDAKLRRIATEGCALFVDDLEEVFAEPAFPGSVERWLYVTDSRTVPAADVTVFSDWSDVARRVQELRTDR